MLFFKLKWLANQEDFPPFWAGQLVMLRSVFIGGTIPRNSAHLPHAANASSTEGNPSKRAAASRNSSAELKGINLGSITQSSS